MNTFVPTFAVLAGLIATAHAQTDQVAGTSAAASVSRLSQLVLDPIPDQADAPVYGNGSASRLGGIQLAQIPQQTGLPPGMNGIKPRTGAPSMHSPLGPPGGNVPVGGNSSVTSSAGSPGGLTPGNPAPGSLTPGNPTPGNLFPSPATATGGSPGRPVSAVPTSRPPQPAMAAVPTRAPSTTAEVPPGDDELVPVAFQNVLMPQILLFYEQLTGKKVIRDINVEAVTFSIDTTGEMPKKKAIDFIEKSLLLNGYGFLPAGEGMVKFINLAAIKPGAEHPFIMKQDELPLNGEEIVTYVQPLLYLEADDLKKTLSELVQLHQYGVVTPLPNTRGVAITENSNTIRYIIELLKTLDVQPSRTEQRSFQLERASADDVAKALADILDLEGKGSSGSGSGSGGKKSGGGQPAPATPQPGQPGAAGQGGAARAAGVYGSAPQAAAAPPKIIPIARTNKLLVIARPTDLEYIATLITELDGAAELRSFITRPLKYLAAHEILPIIKDAISRGLEEGGSGGSSGGGSIVGNNPSGTNSNKTTGNFGSGQSGFGGQGGMNGGMGGGAGGLGGGMGGGAGGLGGGGGLQPLRQNTMPQSLLVGKTLLIADPVLNQIYASGPPEHLRVLQELLDELDKRPRMVMLSVVIGQLKLDDNRDFGVDYVFRPKQIGGGNSAANVAGTAQNRIGTAQGIIDPNAIGSLTDLTKSMPAGLQLFGTIQNQVTVAISALASNTNFKVLSRPTLFTMNNQPASIETGLKIPVPVSSLSSLTTGTANNGAINNGLVSNIQYEDVALRLDVSPLINSDDELTLQVKQVNADVAGSTTLNGNAIPNISNQALETTIMVKNNATVLLGGLIQETTENDRSGIPILKDLPLIKYLASSTKNTKSRHELLVFIQPRIISSTSDEPVMAKDGPGSSPFGNEVSKYITDEHRDPAADDKTVHRSKMSSMIHKLFD